MRTIIVGILILALIWLLIKPLFGKSRALIGAALIAIILIPTAGFEARWLIQEHKGTEVVKLVSDNDKGYLHCQRLSETMFDASQNRGHVMWDKPNEAVVKFSSCQELFGYIESDKSNPTEKQVMAVHVLTHEAVHVGGDMDEASTECKAIQLDMETAIKLGATFEQALHLAQTYYSIVYPRMPSNYTSPDCAENGLMDQTPNDGQFF